MHIAFDGGCFQQALLGGIYQVARGFLNAAKADHPDLEVTLVCDTRQGLVQKAALAGLDWTPDVIYAPLAKSYDPPEPWPTTRDPAVRFYCDGAIVAAEPVGDDGVRYVGPVPQQAFAVLSRSARPVDGGVDTDRRRLGIKIRRVTCTGAGWAISVPGHDRRLAAGFQDGGGAGRWTDGAGFIPMELFTGRTGEVAIEVSFEPQPAYAMQAGLAAEAVLAARRQRNDTIRSQALRDLGVRLQAAGCKAYIANHFTPIIIPGLQNTAWVYDLIPVIMPRYFHEDARANMRENIRVFEQADRLYAISECTRNDLVVQSRVKPGQVAVAGIAPAPGFVPRDPALTNRVAARFGLRNGSYILAVATIEPRKNHVRLMQAYVELRKRMSDVPDLLLVGSFGWDVDDVVAYRHDNGLTDTVKIISQVPEDDLAALYSGALFSAYVSVYEGFGLPIIESMACGCPVVTSDRSSMPEVAGKAALLVDPYSIDSIVRGMEEMATNADLRARLSKLGRTQATQFTWQRSSRMVMDDLAQLIAAT